MEYVPNEVKIHLREPFEAFNFEWVPNFRNGKLVNYSTSIDNLHLSMDNGRLFIQNSWGAFWNGSNAIDYTSSQIESTYYYLDYITDGLINVSNPTKIAIGANITIDINFGICPFIRLMNQMPTPMIKNNITYGYKFIGSKETLKIYSKSQEQYLRKRIHLQDSIVRIELESNVHYLRRNAKIPLYKTSDILDFEVKKSLAKRLLNKLSKVETVMTLPANLSLGEKRIIACMRDPEIRADIRSNHMDTFRKDLRKYRKIRNVSTSFLMEEIISKSKEKLDFLINN